MTKLTTAFINKVHEDFATQYKEQMVLRPDRDTEDEAILLSVPIDRMMETTFRLLNQTVSSKEEAKQVLKYALTVAVKFGTRLEAGRATTERAGMPT